MDNTVWVNLPVADLAKSTAFFLHLGFSFNAQYSNADCTALKFENCTVMLFRQPVFCRIASIDSVTTGTGMLLSVGAKSKEAIDELARKAVEAGGTSDHQPYPMTGTIYGCLFVDLDGHRWNGLYMA